MVISKATDAQIIEKYNEGLSFKEIASLFGYKSIANVTRKLYRNGIHIRAEKRDKRYEQVKRLRDNGATYDEVAEALGVEHSVVQKYCSRVGLIYNADELEAARRRGQNNLCKGFEHWRTKIDKKYNGAFELLEVGDLRDDHERNLTIKCKTCGAVKVISSTTARNAKRGQCDNCLKLERERRERIKAIDKAEAERQKLINKPKKQLTMHFCKCGELLPFNRKVCDKCQKATRNEIYRRKDIKRRARLSAIVSDSDITLEKLYERDKGVCYLCGGLCNWNDSETKDGTFYAGNTYPSVDHIRPIAKGGAHTWDNIRLAHRWCNSIKSDSPLVILKNNASGKHVAARK